MSFQQMFEAFIVTILLFHKCFAAECPGKAVFEPYCSCAPLTYGLKIECDGTLLQSGDEIKQIFAHRSFPQKFIAEFFLFDIPSLVVLPSSVFGDKTVDKMYFSCANDDGYANFETVTDAFEEQETELLSFSRCNLENTDFGFLGGFTRLTKIDVVYSLTNSLAKFPIVATLTNIGITNTPLSSWIQPSNAPSLARLSLDGVGKENVKELMKEIRLQTSLIQIDLPRNGLETVPKELGLMNQLQEVSLDFNPIQILRKGSLHFGASLAYLSFYNCPITEIDSDAFNGDFSNTLLRLESTKLSILDEQVFKPLLEMKFNNYGFIELDQTAINCNCSLSWLVRDNVKLRDLIRNGRCLDGRRFEDLAQEDFADCPGSTLEPGSSTTTETTPTEGSTYWTSTSIFETSSISSTEHKTPTTSVTTETTSEFSTTTLTPSTTTTSITTNSPTTSPATTSSDTTFSASTSPSTASSTSTDTPTTPMPITSTTTVEATSSTVLSSTTVAIPSTTDLPTTTTSIPPATTTTSPITTTTLTTTTSPTTTTISSSASPTTTTTLTTTTSPTTTTIGSSASPTTTTTLTTTASPTTTTTMKTTSSSTTITTSSTTSSSSLTPETTSETTSSSTASPTTSTTVSTPVTATMTSTTTPSSASTTVATALLFFIVSFTLQILY